MAIIVDIVSPVEVSGEVSGQATVIEVVRNVTATPIQTTAAESVVEVVKPGGTIANAQWGPVLPASGTEGQIFVVLTQ